MKKKIIIIVIILILLCLSVLTITLVNNKNSETTEGNNNEITEEVIITEKTQKLVDDTIYLIEEGEELETTEAIESTEQEEENLEEEALEPDAQVEQENISWDGDNTGSGIDLLGAYQGLTYYNQADSRWANTLYTSTGDTSQTMKSSGCGPTAAAMVVSSSKGAILPTTMANLFVDNGYRTANNGTAWACWSFTADYFGFNDYTSTSSLNTAINYLNQGYYVVVSVGSGLFTTGGHYIVLVGIDGDTLQIYDPYLYSGKFDTTSRRGKVTVSGNTVYCSVSNFSTYANYRNFWCFSNDSGSGNTNTDSSTTVNYTRYVSTSSSNLNVRSGAGTGYSVIGSLAKGTTVTVSQISGSWSYITSPTTGWVSTQYLSASVVTSSSTSTSSTSYTTGTYRVTASLLNVRSGAGTNYSKKTYSQLTSNARKQNEALGNYYANGYLKGVECKVSQISGDWGKTPSGWINLSYCTKISDSTSTTTSTSSTVGTYKRLASRTYLYSNSNLTGTKYTYLALTQVKIIKNISSSVDYVYVVKTGRYAYVSTSAYK